MSRPMPWMQTRGSPTVLEKGLVWDEEGIRLEKLEREAALVRMKVK